MSDQLAHLTALASLADAHRLLVETEHRIARVRRIIGHQRAHGLPPYGMDLLARCEARRAQLVDHQQEIIERLLKRAR